MKGIDVDDWVTATLAHALLRIPHYQRLRDTLPDSPTLLDFPVINGDHVAQDPESFYCLDGVPDFVAVTGGTTSEGKFFFVNYDEMDSTFCHRVGITSTDHFDPNSVDGIAILLVDMQHGFVPPPSHGQPVIALPLEVGRHLPLVLRFLEHGIVVAGRRLPVIEMFGSITKLRALTRYAKLRGVDGRKFGLRRMMTLAFHASRKWKDELNAFWGADIQDGYGLSEFLGAVSPKCAACGGYHLPHVVHAEFLDDDLIKPIRRGVALLVLTTLFPFRRAMPFIRYNTQDLVEVLSPCPSTGNQGFAFLGREGLTLRAPKDRRLMLLTSLDVMDVVDSVAEEFPNSIVYDDQVDAVMSWGSGFPPDAFRGVGYPQMAISVKDAHYHIVLEVASTDGCAVDLMQRRISYRLNDLASQRGSGSFVDGMVRVACVGRGELNNRGLKRTIV